MKFIERWQKWDVGGWQTSPIRWAVYALAMIALLSVCLWPAKAASHSATLSWALSVDDDAGAATPVNCVAAATCMQNVYRAAGSCSATSNFTLLTGVALSPTVTTYTDSTLHPGVWCYGVTFSINGLESAKDEVTVQLQPSPVTGLTGSAQ